MNGTQVEVKAKVEEMATSVLTGRYCLSLNLNLNLNVLGAL